MSFLARTVLRAPKSSAIFTKSKLFINKPSLIRINHLSTDAKSNSPAFTKLRDILEKYRKANYNQTLPTRYAKELLAAVDKNNDGNLTKEEICQVLENIGEAGHLSDEEIDSVLVECDTSGDGKFSKDEFMRLL